MVKRTATSQESGSALSGGDGLECRNETEVERTSQFLVVPDSVPDRWPPDLTHRVRVLLHTLPLDSIRRSDSMCDTELRHYDGLALALRVLDIVIDRLGLEAEADREVVMRVVEPALSAMDTAAGVVYSPERHERMLDRLLAGLHNDADARRPFREEYTTIDGEDRVRRHALEFRLLFDAFHPSGRTVLRPSPEACNLYLRLLDRHPDGLLPHPRETALW